MPHIGYLTQLLMAGLLGRLHLLSRGSVVRCFMHRDGRVEHLAETAQRRVPVLLIPGLHRYLALLDELGHIGIGLNRRFNVLPEL